MPKEPNQADAINCGFVFVGFYCIRFKTARDASDIIICILLIIDIKASIPIKSNPCGEKKSANIDLTTSCFIYIKSRGYMCDILTFTGNTTLF